MGEQEQRAHRIALGIIFVFSAAIFALSLARYTTFHNSTFDLAFYSRMAWGLAHFDFWDPILEAHVFGLHISPILVPLGGLGWLFGATAPVLLAAQATALGGAAHALGRMGARRLGHWGWVIGALALLAHPNVGHAGSFEAHPGTMAVWPLALAIDRLDALDRRGFVLGVVGVLLCREDLALVTGALGLLAVRTSMRRTGWRVALGSLCYLGVFLFVVHPMFAPEVGSLEAHFGKWGGSFPEILTTWVTRPDLVLAHILAPERLWYLLLLLLPLGLLPLGAPRWWVPALPILGINLISEFPTAIDIKEHYTTTALPMLVAAAIATQERLLERLPRRPALAAFAACLGVSLLVWGVSPMADEFWPDERSAACAQIVDVIAQRDPGGDRSLQIPDPMLAHTSERLRVFRAPPPDRNADLVVIDATIRAQFLHSGTVQRTDQEPTLRNWLSRDGYGVVAVAAPWAMLERDADPRAGPLSEYIVGHTEEAGHRGQRLTECLRVLEVVRIEIGVELELEARGPCPADLALRIDTEMATHRTDLLFDGWLSPAHLRQGDILRSRHELPNVEDALFLGAVRSSGARAAPADPPWLRVLVSGSQR